MQNIISREKIKVENMIYEIRGKQVMLDSDLAKLYHVETKRINEAVRNNPLKFPERFCWTLTKNEWFFLRSKFSTLENDIPGKGHYRKFLPKVFTEQGVAMLATILKSKIAVETSIRIMDAFVLMKKYISTNLLEQQYLNNLVLQHEERLKLVEKTFSNFKEKNNHLFFKGQVYDAYSLLLNILNKSKKEIIIIDNYIDKNLLDILSKKNKEITIITNKYNNIDYTRYKEQYKNVKLKINN
ncbi:MAG: ORF6N domain-containing protein, partial [Bacilli bacterium]|nr:ORF6N domain-containing protein [Bacilli bacterium]